MGKRFRGLFVLTIGLGTGILGTVVPSRAAVPECPPRNCSPVVNEKGGKDCPNIHNMLVVGNEAVFLSHLSMFGLPNREGGTYLTPHRFQVILEATFDKGGHNAQEDYTSDRREHPSTKMYTLNPECLVLSDLFTPVPQNPALTSFKATVFRGHLERGGEPIEQLENVNVTLKNVVYARMFDPTDAKPEKLTYILFGKGRELFLAHWISKPPDFDQIVSVNLDSRPFLDEQLDRGIEVVIPSRQNSSLSRVKPGEALSAQGHARGAHQFLPLNISVGTEFYFEEGELFSPPTFDPTEEERRSGFGN